LEKASFGFINTLTGETTAIDTNYADETPCSNPVSKVPTPLAGFVIWWFFHTHPFKERDPLPGPTICPTDKPLPVGAVRRYTTRPFGGPSYGDLTNSTLPIYAGATGVILDEDNVFLYPRAFPNVAGDSVDLKLWNRKNVLKKQRDFLDKQVCQ
jgi:hypothetical protein